MKNLIDTKKILLVFCLLLFVPLMSCDEIWIEEGYYEYYESDYVYEEYEEIVEVVDDDDEDDASGGLDYWSSIYKGSSRNFHAAYELDEFHSSCIDHGYGDPDLELPTWLYAYSYGDMMDFETSASRLVWNAELYDDDTFEFETNYLDWYGHPSVDFPCSCTIYHHGEWDESIECSCDPSNTYSSCSFVYELIFHRTPLIYRLMCRKPSRP